MDIETLMVFGIPAVIFAVTVWMTFWMSKRAYRLGLISLGLVWLVFTAGMFFGLEQAVGWDGLGFLLALIGISAPVGVGAIIGGAIGLVKREDVVHA